MSVRRTAPAGKMKVRLKFRIVNRKLSLSFAREVIQSEMSLHRHSEDELELPPALPSSQILMDPYLLANAN